MFKRFWLLSLLAIPLGLSTAWGQVTLVRKPIEGAEYKERTTVKLDQKLTLGGQDASTAATTVVEQKTSIGKREADGKLSMVLATEIRSSDITLPGGVKIKFDAANPDSKDDKSDNPLYEIIRDKLKANAKSSITLILDKDDKILDIQGVKPESGVSPDDLKQDYEESLKLLPTKAVKKGDTWEQDVKMNLGQGQMFTLKRKFTYEGESFKSTVSSSRKLHKITAVDSAVEYWVKEGGGFPGKVTKSELKIADSKHTLLYDPALSRIAESTSTLRVSGPIGLSIMGVELGGDLDLTMESKEEEIK